MQDEKRSGETTVASSVGLVIFTIMIVGYLGLAGIVRLILGPVETTILSVATSFAAIIVTSLVGSLAATVSHHLYWAMFLAAIFVAATWWIAYGGIAFTAAYVWS
jgi:hypothetical protein